MRIDRSLLTDTTANSSKWRRQIGAWMNSGKQASDVAAFLRHVCAKEVKKSRMTQNDALQLVGNAVKVYNSMATLRGQFANNPEPYYVHWDSLFSAQNRQSSVLQGLQDSYGFSLERAELEWELYLKNHIRPNVPLPQGFDDEEEYFATLLEQGITDANVVKNQLPQAGFGIDTSLETNDLLERFNAYVANAGQSYNDRPTTQVNGDNPAASKRPLPTPVTLGGLMRVENAYRAELNRTHKGWTNKGFQRAIKQEFGLDKTQTLAAYNFWDKERKNFKLSSRDVTDSKNFYKQSNLVESSAVRIRKGGSAPLILGEIAKEYGDFLSRGNTIGPSANGAGTNFSDDVARIFGLGAEEAQEATRFFFARLASMQGDDKAAWDKYINNPASTATPDTLKDWFAAPSSVQRAPSTAKKATPGYWKDMQGRKLSEQDVKALEQFFGPRAGWSKMVSPPAVEVKAQAAESVDVRRDKYGYASIDDTENILANTTLSTPPAADPKNEPGRRQSQGYFEWLLSRRRGASDDYVAEMAKRHGVKVNRSWLAPVRNAMGIKMSQQEMRELTAYYRAQDLLNEDEDTRKQRIGEIAASGRVPEANNTPASLLERILPTSAYHREGRRIKSEIAEKQNALGELKNLAANTYDTAKREKLGESIDKLAAEIRKLEEQREAHDRGYRVKGFEEHDAGVVDVTRRVVEEISKLYDSEGNRISNAPLSEEAARFVNASNTAKFEEEAVRSSNKKTKAELANERRREARNQRIEMMADKGATYGRTIGETFGGRGSKLAGVGEKFGAVLGKVAGKFLIIIEITRKVVEAIKNIYATARENVDKMLSFAQYNGLLGVAKSRHLGRETIRNIRYARATAKSGSKLISAWDDLEDELTPVRSLWQNIKNGPLTWAVQVLTLCMKGVNAVGKFFKYVGKGIASIIGFLNPFSAFRTSNSLDGAATARGDGGYNRPEAKKGYGRMESLSESDYSRKIRNREGEGGTILVSEGFGEAPKDWDKRTDLEKNLDAQIGIVNGKVTDDNRKYNATVRAFQSSEEMFADVRQKAEKRAKKDGQDVQKAGDEAVGAKFKELEKNQRFLGLMEAEYEEELSSAKSKDWSGFNAGVTPGVASNANSDRVSKKYQEQKDFALSYGLDKNATYYARIGELYKKQDAGEDINDSDIVEATGAKGKKEIDVMRKQLNKWRESGDYQEFMAYSGRQNALRTGQDTSKFDELLKTAKNSLITQQLQAERTRTVAENSGEIQADVKKIAKKEQREVTDLMRNAMLKMANSYAVSEDADRTKQEPNQQYGRFAGATVENWGLR